MALSPQGLTSGTLQSISSARVEGHLGLGVSFLDLPPEIRNRIYDYVFVSDEYIGASSTRTTGFYRDAAKYRNLAFASSCRQVYQESANIFYAKNGFEFFCIRPFLEFIEAIGPGGRKLLTRLKYHCSKGTPFIVLRYLRSCTNLKELEVSARVAMPGKRNSGCDYPVKDARDFFLGSRRAVEFGEGRCYGVAQSAPCTPPQYHVGKVKASLVKSLERVKQEQSGVYRRPDLPDVFSNGRCAWRL